MLNEVMLEELTKICAFAASKGTMPGTTGNFSARIDDNAMVISAKNTDKSALTKFDVLICDMHNNLLSGDALPSEDSVIHGLIYQQDQQANCVFQTHSVSAMVMSFDNQSNQLSFEGYELQKVIAPYSAQTLNLPILDNLPNKNDLLEQIKARWQEIKNVKTFLIKGNGLYSWGATVLDAKTRMEAMEFLLECECKRYSVR